MVLKFISEPMHGPEIIKSDRCMLPKFISELMHGFKIYFGADAWSRNFIGLTDYVLETLVACYCCIN